MDEKKEGDGKKENPRLCRVNQDFEPFNKWVPGFVCFRLPATRKAEQDRHAHHKQV